MIADEQRRRVLELFERVINSHDLAAIGDYTADADIEGTVRSLLEAFPDLRFDIVWTAAEADRVVSFVEMSGTHDGPWLMVREGTHRQMRASLLLAFRLDADGMIVDSWLGTNFIAMLAQLGWGVAPMGEVVPRPEAPD